MAAFQKSLSFSTFSTDTVPAPDRRTVRTEQFEAASRGELQMVVHEVLPLEQAVLAHQKMTVGEVFGRIVLVPSGSRCSLSDQPRLAHWNVAIVPAMAARIGPGAAAPGGAAYGILAEFVPPDQAGADQLPATRTAASARRIRRQRILSHDAR